MEISKMLTLSTSHVTDKTLKLLNTEANGNNFPCLAVYKKEDYGYFIYIDKDAYIRDHSNMPGDLNTVVSFAIETGCNILCLDCDGEELVCLPHYEYWDNHDTKPVTSSELCYCGGQLLNEKPLNYHI